MAGLLTRALAVLLLCLALPAPAAAEEYQVGFRSLSAWLPGERTRVDVAVWYPTARAPARLTLDGWTFPAARNATPLQGPWPLIMLSHDSPGSRFAHHDLATRLARAGYIVAAPTHDGDNAADMSLLFTAEQLPTRARQIRAALDLTLNHAVLGPQVDRRRIGLVGFGNGGTAALLLAGAELSQTEWARYREAGKGGPDPYLAPGMAANLDAMTHAMADEEDRREEAAHLHERAEASYAKALQRAQENVAKAYPRIQRTLRKPFSDFPRPPVFLPRPPALAQDKPLADTRFHAIVLVSPGFSMLFDPASLGRVTLPVLLIGAERDVLNWPEQQALAFRRLLPHSEYLGLAGADGPALLAPCPPETPDAQADSPPDICESVTPEQRENLHSQLRQTLLDFFANAL